MDYLYENLGDERFQEFCSNLISKEFPNIQAFPVGQPDGGRDSIVYSMDSVNKEFIVFQVKFVKNPNQQRDVSGWLTEIIKGELEKINKLIFKGAKQYYLLTNVRGTAHLDVGSKDKINKILEENIKIPSICWWRDDLSILFEKDPLFKWSFPEILSGQDILNSVLFQNLQENKERRENVIRAYLIDQYGMDNEVKFKQIDLQNRLLNLFTDVPLRIKKINEKNKLLRQTLESVDSYSHRFIGNEELFSIDDRTKMGAAEFLLHPKVQNEIERILLEGGPGQGKSTISQYVSQVHRVKLLNKQSDIDLLPNNIKNSPIRLPFKIDLRDLAAWVEKKNPYQESFTKEYFDSIWKNSLESFLVAHIHYHAKIEIFTTNDFIAICKLSPVLIVFDGFDEIANIKVRSDVIDFINKGITRISGNTKSMQVIITSRPAAFSSLVGFSIDNYPHFELTDITLSIINEYVEKWLKASNLHGRDASEIKKLVKEKLEMPHLKDLAKSPMQLAIFLSLLRTKGQSLPDKRTALYDSYINLFFDRESEKSTLIREKRDLVIDIHQYLAWVLHSEAELYKKSGSIHFEDLRTRLKEYLGKEGHDISIAEQLFDVMKERVCALVSRVQGTFEFEVQPLREYFCAKYLYTTAQNSTAGSVKTGTKPDRFHAILRNSYWQNVVRFFAGCADAGELDMIIQELKDLQNDEFFKYTNYPRIITAQILSDYVFTQKPYKLRDVVKIIIDGINIGNVINQDRQLANNEPLLLQNECGGKEVFKECFQQLMKFPAGDYAYELINVINNNPFNALEIWCEFAQKLKGEQLTKWLEYAYSLQLIYKIDAVLLVKILKEGDNIQTLKRLQLVVSGNRLEIVNEDIELKRVAFTYISDNMLAAFQRSKKEHSFQSFALILHPYILANILTRENDNRSFAMHLNRYLERHHNDNPATESLLEFEVVDQFDKLIFEFIDRSKEILNIEISKFKDRIEVWDKLIENGRLVFKDNWKLYVAATVAAGIKSKEETYEDFTDLNNSSLSLCKRIRCARMKSGNVKYWETQIRNSKDISFTLLVFFSWATPKAIIQLLPVVSKLLKSLDINDFSKLARAINSSSYNSTFNKAQEAYIEHEMKDKKRHDEVKYFLSLRFGENRDERFIYENIEKFSGVLEKVNLVKYQYLLDTYLTKTTDMAMLKEIKKIYQSIDKFGQKNFHTHNSVQTANIPIEIAKTIMSNCKSFPRIISSLAEKSCRLYANQNMQPVGKTAKDDKWFEEDL